MRRCTFILMPKERGLKTEFIKKNCVGGLYKSFLRTDGRTDRRTDGQTKSNINREFASRLKLPKNDDKD